MSELPAPPDVRVEVLEDRTPAPGGTRGFLRLRRYALRTAYPDGTRSEAYEYDVVEREAMDAVAMVLVASGEDGPRICLRSSLRPPLAFRPGYALPLPDPGRAVLWEVPAGLVEPGERGEAGLRACAVRETLEEVGLHLSPDAFSSLGAPACLSPGVLGEKIYFLTARVDPSQRTAPLEDGSPVEERAAIEFVPLGVALDAVRDGRIEDLKTEVAVRRLAAERGLT